MSRKVLLIFVLAILVSSACYCYLQLQGSSQGDLSIEQAKILIESKPNLVIVDVRTPEEYATGYIEGALNLCAECDAQLLLDSLNPSDEILLYCRTGRRSANALRIQGDNSYEKVYNMVGGIEAWKNAGYPVVNSCGVVCT